MFSHSLLVAYIDPSAGGMLVQMLLAGTAGLAVLGKLFWTRIKTAVGIKDKTPPADDVHDGQQGQ